MTEDVDAPPRPNALSDAALARHARRMRPLRIIYAAALTVAAIVIAVIVAVAYNRGEISHVTLTTVDRPPAKVALQAASATQTKAWSSSDTTGIGTPYNDGTIITHDAHTVRGRNALTGKQTWSYTRTDRTVCTAIQAQGVTIAVYKLKGDCDELTALDSNTGARRWTRTLDKDTAVFDGPASYWVQGGEVMFVSKTSVYALAVSGTSGAGNGGLDYWTFHHVGCTINGAVLGLGGALISQTCAHEDCGSAKFCGNGRQLLLRDITAGYDDNAKDNNPDQIKWNLFGNDLVPTAAGHSLAARDPSGSTLSILDIKTGKATTRLPLTGRPGSSAPAGFASTYDGDLIWLDGRTYALRAAATSFAWQTDTASIPTVTDPAGTSSPTLAAARLAVPASTGIVELDGTNGRAHATYAVGAAPAGSLAFPFGTGFVVAGPTTTVYR